MSPFAHHSADMHIRLLMLKIKVYNSQLNMYKIEFDRLIAIEILNGDRK